MQLQGEKTREALRQADAWRRTAIAGQFQHLLVNADKALNEGKQDRARALALAAHEIMTAQDTTASGGIAYKNSLLASLPSNLRELYAFQGESVSSDVVARYSENGNVIAWTDKRDRNVNLTDASTGRLVKQFQRTTSRIRSLSFSQNATQLALVSNGRQIELFDLDKGRLNEANGVLSSARVDAVAFGESVQGAILVGVSENGLRAWRLNPVVVELTSDAPPSESGGHKSTSSSASAVDCARTRCAYFDGSRLYIYEVDEVIRQIAIGANITTELKQDGDEDRSTTQLRMLGDVVLLRIGARWKSYQQSDQSIQEAAVVNLDDPSWPLVSTQDGKSFLTVAKRQGRSFVISVSLSKKSDEWEERTIGVVNSAATIIALAPDRSGVLSLSETQPGALKIVRFERFPTQACKNDDCRNLFVSKAGAVYMGGKNAIFRYDPITQRFNLIVDNLRELDKKKT